VQLLNQNARLIVRIKNSGEKAIEGNRLALKLNGQSKGMADFSVGAGSYTYDTIGFVINQSGWNKAELSLQDFPITYDDTYYFAFQVADKVRVLAITENKNNVFLDAVFKDQSEFDYKSVPSGSLDYSQIKGNQFVVLSNLNSISSGLSAALNSFLTNGGTVCVFPGYKCDLESYNTFFSSLGLNIFTGLKEEQQEVSKIDLQQELFKDMFEKVPENMGLPKVSKYYAINGKIVSLEPSILTLKNGDEFLYKEGYGPGIIYVCASPLDKAYSDLPIHAIFAPMMYKMAIMGTHAENMAYVIGDKKGIEIASRGGGADKVYKVKGDQLEFIPEQFALGSKVILGLKDQIKKSGFYKVSLENSDSADIIALNYDRQESNLDFYKADELKSKYNAPNMTVVNSLGLEVAQVIKEMDRGVSLWKLFLVLALAALAAETLLLRFWRK